MSEPARSPRAPSIADILPPLPTIKIVDVGALEMPNHTEPYVRLAKNLRCEVVGFEPNVAECERLRGLGRPGRTYLPYFIGDGGRHTFYECNLAAASSLLEPNMPLLDRFQNIGDASRVVKTRPVETRRLDDIPEAAKADYLKIDVQGAELMVFRNATELLRHTLVIHTEVEFVPMYKDQPLFADVDAFLRAQGFVVHSVAWAGRTFKPLIWQNDLNAALSQLLWGEAIYVRDFMNFDRLTPERLLTLAAILHEGSGSIDLATVALAEHDRQTGSSLQQTYIKWLMQQAPQLQGA